MGRSEHTHQRKPDWLRIPVRGGRDLNRVKALLKSLHLNTVCVEANCPNRMECFASRTATFMVLGSVCTRNCRFCNVSPGTPEPVDAEEPVRLARAARELGLRHVVVTSVTRDDLPDGGAGHFAAVIRELRTRLPEASIEVLIPDFQGDPDALATVIEAGPEVINHNVETVPRLYSRVRPQADYRRSLELLKRAADCGRPMAVKTGLMLGLGETREEVLELFDDLRRAGCDFLTIGQYLAPSSEHYPVAEYVKPEVFDDYRKEAEKRGFRHVASAPFVRSSYKAAEALEGKAEA
ncbi:lipoyl synthase [Marispirochaeta aestuarii]|uniref:Lipoyl synthase n=1 Tax=Marispirochaeta aestuarii TaxID=1963862 RepID=A0A1Y1RZ66_9SPIO|nr:lipoyl synthase [Marispirochaeta aestuarii]ORC35921.1 lipoyl synthase [Marispirochaeta aestuarii]